MGVTIGGTLGHALCTGLAVIGGRLIAQRISVRTGDKHYLFLRMSLSSAIFFFFFCSSLYNHEVWPFLFHDMRHNWINHKSRNNMLTKPCLSCNQYCTIFVFWLALFVVLSFSDNHWWNCLFDICIDSTFYWRVIQKSWTKDWRFRHMLQVQHGYTVTKWSKN